MQGERGNHVDWLVMAGLSVRSELGGVTTPGQCYITSWPRTHAEARQQDRPVTEAPVDTEQLTRL